MKRPKMCILIRTDLNMPIGKIISQASNASVNQMRTHGPDLVWFGTGMKTITLQVDNEKQLFEFHQKAQSLVQPVSSYMQKDAEGVYTCCAIGPADDTTMEKITGSLKLL